MSKLSEALAKSKAQQKRKGDLKGNGSSPVGDEDRPESAADVAIKAEQEEVQLLLESKSRDLQVIEEQYKFTPEELASRRIIHAGADNNEIEKAFRNLRTRVLEKTGGKNSTILITSAGSGEGTNFVTINLACAFGFDVRRTAVVVDCNLQEPAYYTELVEDEGPGLTDHLDNSEITLDKVIYKTGIPRVRVVPVGQNRSSKRDYFTEEGILRFLQMIKRRFKERFVFLDAPPINHSADTRALVKLADFVILVIPYGGATLDEVRHASEIIGDEKLLGAVLNNEPKI